MKHRTRLCTLLGLVLALMLLPNTASRSEAQTAERCFPETGQCIAGRIREFWEQNGGLPVFGFPIGLQREEQIEGKPFQVQWFERNRLELHPENARPYDVLIGRLGADRLQQQGRDWFTFPKSEPKTDCRFFSETGHNICGAILAAWRAQGLDLDGRRAVSEAESLGLFGLPLSDEQTETIEGKQYTVQWFERARFELHPENQPPYNVLLGRLGVELGSAPAPTPAPAPVPSQFDGYWDGQAPEKTQITLTISGGRVIFVQIDVDCGSRSTTFSSRQKTPINNASFQVTNNLFSVAGSFADGGVSGTLKISRPDIECGGLLNGPWAAHFAGPAPLDGYWQGTMGNTARISFFVNRGVVTDVDIRTPGCASIKGVTLSEDYPIDGNSFYAGGSDGKIGVSGTFNSDNAASGSVEYQLPDCSFAGPWTATKQ